MIILIVLLSIFLVLATMVIVGKSGEQENISNYDYIERLQDENTKNV